MRPVKFRAESVPGVTFTGKTYAEHQPDYLPLPVLRVDEDQYGTVISCWQLSWRERWRVFRTGRMFVSVMSFDKPLQPIRPATTFHEYFEEEK